MKERRHQHRHQPKVYLTVYDAATGAPLGQLVNMSSEGAMLVTPEPVKVGSRVRCRLNLPLRLMERDAIEFDAECRWCRKNIPANRWESGYQLAVASEDAEIIPYLIIGFEIGGWGDEGPLPEVKTIDLSNRRQSTRYEFDYNLPVYEFDNYRQIGELADLSTEGVRIISRRPVEKGDRLRCRVKLNRTIFQEDYLFLEVRCMWSREISGSTQFESGHRIVNISRRDAAIVMNLIFHDGRPCPGQRTARLVD
jgi:hypothetical protein